jgi:hypothetical protein
LIPLANLPCAWCGGPKEAHPGPGGHVGGSSSAEAVRHTRRQQCPAYRRPEIDLAGPVGEVTMRNGQHALVVSLRGGGRVATTDLDGCAIVGDTRPRWCFRADCSSLAAFEESWFQWAAGEEPGFPLSADWRSLWGRAMEATRGGDAALGPLTVIAEHADVHIEADRASRAIMRAERGRSLEAWAGRRGAWIQVILPECRHALGWVHAEDVEAAAPGKPSP